MGILIQSGQSQGQVMGPTPGRGCRNWTGIGTADTGGQSAVWSVQAPAAARSLDEGARSPAGSPVF